jgi:UDP-glucose 6-dehydrogenase
MKVLSVGQGVVGDATGYALEQRGHEVTYHDPPKGLEASPNGCDCVLICVPTPRGALGYNSRAQVYKTGDLLQQQGYTGLVGIRSTVIPGTCDDMQTEFPAMTWFAWPEFLRASLAREMAANPPYKVVGYPDNADGSRCAACASIAWLTMGSEGPDGKTLTTTPTGAEFIKYATNAILAATVGVANELADWATALGLDYNAILPPICNIDPTLPSNVHVTAEGGFGGACLPKDLAALLFHSARDQQIELPILALVERENNRRRDSEGVAHSCE